MIMVFLWHVEKLDENPLFLPEMQFFYKAQLINTWYVGNTTADSLFSSLTQKTKPFHYSWITGYQNWKTEGKHKKNYVYQ